MQMLDTINSMGPEPWLAGPWSPGLPLLLGRSALLQGGLWTEKGMVSRQQEHGEKKRADREGSLRAWEAGIPQVGNWQCPPSQREQGWEGVGGRVWEQWLGRRARKDSLSLACERLPTPCLLGLQGQAHSHANPLWDWEAGPQTVQGWKTVQGQENTAALCSSAEKAARLKVCHSRDGGQSSD